MADKQYLDISKIKWYLQKARVVLNKDDKIEVDGSLDELYGRVETLGGNGPIIHFKVLSRHNGTFVDWHGGGTSQIKKVE